MAREEKPYRVYRGGRAKGKVPVAARPERGRVTNGKDGADGGARVDYRGPSGRRRRFGRGRKIGLGVLLLFVLAVAWGVTSYLSFRGGVRHANKALDPNARLALNEQSGLLLSHETTILALGTDNSRVGGRAGDRHSDSIMLVRSDPQHHRLSYLSIPRDLRVPIPGYGEQKINAAMQIGGPALAIKTVREFTGLRVNHVVVVNFADFKDLIDALGGVTVDVPARILSDRFDCPYATAARCQQWQGWRFRTGSQRMDGQRALIYSRIRINQLNRSESDVTRGARQQAVIQAVMGKFTSPATLAKLPFKGSSLVTPLTTDLSPGQLMSLGWVKFRSSTGSAIHCRLGGDSSSSSSDLIPSEDNRNVISEFQGTSAPQPPTAGSPYAPGCVTGHVLQ